MNSKSQLDQSADSLCDYCQIKFDAQEDLNQSFEEEEPEEVTRSIEKFEKNNRRS